MLTKKQYCVLSASAVVSCPSVRMSATLVYPDHTVLNSLQTITWYSLGVTKKHRSASKDHQVIPGGIGGGPVRYGTRSQAVARIADRTAKNCKVT